MKQLPDWAYTKTQEVRAIFHQLDSQNHQWCRLWCRRLGGGCCCRCRWCWCWCWFCLCSVMNKWVYRELLKSIGNAHYYFRLLFFSCYYGIRWSKPLNSDNCVFAFRVLSSKSNIKKTAFLIGFFATVTDFDNWTCTSYIHVQYAQS